MDQGQGNYNFGVSVNNACGTGGTYYKTYAITCGANSAVMVSPNPSNGTLNVALSGDVATESESGIAKNASLTSVDGPITAIYKINVISDNGAVIKTLNFNGVRSTTINLTGIPSGVYTLQVFDRHNWTSKKVVIVK